MLHHRRAKRHIMVMMFMRGVVLVDDGNPVLFLLYKSYRVGVFVLPGVILAIFLIKSSDISKLLAMFWHLSICISLFVQTNRAYTCMCICQTNMDIQADRACGTGISPRSFVISFVILYVCNIVQYRYLTFCHYVSSWQKEISDARMQTTESHCCCTSSASHNKITAGMNGGMVIEWRNGGMADLRNGGMAEW